MAKLMWRLWKGFLYGVVVGIFFALAIFLLSTAVTALGVAIGVTPAVLAGLVFAAALVGGIGMEYANWIDEQKT